MELNPKKYEIGEVVFYIVKDGNEQYVSFGTVLEHYPGSICIQLYDTPERRLVNGIPIDEISFPTQWKKLPKGWTYDTELYDLSWADCLEETFRMRMDNKSDIKSSIDRGYLVKVQDKKYGTLDTEITKDGWRLYRKWDAYEYHPSYISCNYWEVYGTYGEAFNVIAEYKKELERQANLSDYEWSVEQIDKTLNRCVLNTPEEIAQMREFLLAQGNVEDIETRISGGQLQWKYWKNKRWLTIPTDKPVGLSNNPE